MSQLVHYIRSLKFASFADLEAHFVAKNCRIVTNETTYMVIPPMDFSIYSEESVEFIKAISQAVGTILSIHDNSIVCFGFPKTHEVQIDSPAPIEGRVWTTEYLHGTLLRAFHDGRGWHLSTNGAPNAYSTYWISKKSIGQLFDECLSRIYRQDTSFSTSPLVSKLIPSYTYQFILQHPEMHLELVDRPKIFHIGTYDNKKMTYDYTLRADRLPQPICTLMKDWTSAIYNLRTRLSTLLGYTIYAEHCDDQTPRYKVFNTEYCFKKSLLGRTSNLYLRCIEAQQEGTLDLLLTHFPNIRYYASWVNKCLRIVAGEVHRLFIEKYPKKNHNVAIPFHLRPVVQDVKVDSMAYHTFVTPESVLSLLTKYHPKKLNFILNGLGHINTGDVPIPSFETQHKEEQEVVSFTDSELDELDAMVDLVESHRPTYEVLASLDEEQQDQYITNKIFPIVQNELHILTEEQGKYTLLTEMDLINHILFSLSSDQLCEIVDDSFALTELIHEIKDDVLNIIECPF